MDPRLLALRAPASPTRANSVCSCLSLLSPSPGPDAPPPTPSDPKKDVEAEILAIRAGLKSRNQVISERGYDAEQVDAEIEADKERADGLDLTFGQSVAAQQKAPTDG